MFDGNRIEIGAGTLYAAPLGTTEPTAVTGAWPAGWLSLGYTDTGSTFAYALQTAAVTVEEELLPVKVVATGATADLSFSLAELTARNLALVLNGGFGSSLVTGVETVNGDGSISVQPPTPGTEVYVMLGWDAIAKQGITGTDPGTGLERLIVRQALNTGSISVVARKGNNKRVYAAKFSAVKPANLAAFSYIFPPNRAY